MLHGDGDCCARGGKAGAMSRASSREQVCEVPGCYGEARHWRDETRQWICAACLTPVELKNYSKQINHSEKLRAQHIEKREKAKPDPRRGQFGWKFKQQRPQANVVSTEPEDSKAKARE